MAVLLTLLALLAPQTTPTPQPTLTGLDVLIRTDFAALRNARVGLITNHTGRSSTNQTTISAFLATDSLTLVALFSPEHGIAGALDTKIPDARDPASNLPIYSLYGDNRAPTPTQLADLDTLVFDIQDIGCRFYTYISTMGLAMHAAAAHHKRFVVLDRPNPIGGTIVEGPVRDPGPDAFVAYHSLPLRHGMTAGELARMFAAEKPIAVDLHVIPLEHWSSRQTFDLTGLEWINPSPNMRSLTEALLYPGVGLLEFTNLSVGRGTDTPFEHIGAPWLDGRALARRLHAANLPGVTFVPTRFTPNASKFANQPCSGVQIAITDRAIFRAIPLGLALATALHTQHPTEWDMRKLTTLLLDAATYQSIQDNAPWQTTAALHAKELDEFLTRRARFLLYR